MSDPVIQTHIARLQRLKTLADTYKAATGQDLMDPGQYDTCTAAIAALYFQEDNLSPTTIDNMRYGLLAERYQALVQAVIPLLNEIQMFHADLVALAEPAAEEVARAV